MASSEEIVRLLNGKRIGKGKWIAKCPSHPDKNPSLSIVEGRRGTLILCQSQRCALEDIVSNIGLRVRDLFYTSRDATSEQLKALSRQRRIDALYAQEMLRQDYRMVYHAMKHPPEIKLYSYIQDQFTAKVESMCVRLESSDLA